MKLLFIIAFLTYVCKYVNCGHGIAVEYKKQMIINSQKLSPDNITRFHSTNLNQEYDEPNELVDYYVEYDLPKEIPSHSMNQPDMVVGENDVGPKYLPLVQNSDLAAGSLNSEINSNNESSEEITVRKESLHFINNINACGKLIDYHSIYKYMYNEIAYTLSNYSIVLDQSLIVEGASVLVKKSRVYIIYANFEGSIDKNVFTGESEHLFGIYVNNRVVISCSAQVSHIFDKIYKIYFLQCSGNVIVPLKRGDRVYVGISLTHGGKFKFYRIPGDYNYWGIAEY